MKVAYQYKLLPTYEQRCQMTRWLDMLRHQYNYLLSERFDWWQMNRCAVNACPLPQGPVQLKAKPDYYSQKRSLVELKKERPWYKDIQSQVLQDMVKRVDLAFKRFVSGDGNGKRSGRPRYKGKNRYRTFVYPQLKASDVSDNQVNLSKVGPVKFIQHRPIPDGFTAKRALITRTADGWYVTLTLENKAVPDAPTVDVLPTWENSIGIDAGLEYFVADSEGGQYEPAKFYRQSEAKLAALQVKREERAKGAKARRKLNERIAQLHQKIARQRKQWHYEIASDLVAKADVIFIEDLKVSNMMRRNKAKRGGDGEYIPNGQAAKSGLNKSFADAGIAGFLNEILPYKAGKAGRLVVKVNPAGTSQHCAICLNKVPKSLGDRWHSCACGAEMPRDTNSGILIKKVGLGIASLKNAKPRKRGGEARALQCA